MSIAGQTVAKTPMRIKMRSLPKASVNRYLDLYVLTRKRTKLELELQALLKRKKSIDDDLKDLDKEIRKIGRTIFKEDGRRNTREAARKETRESFRTIVMEY